jgi:hypothetical protein
MTFFLTALTKSSMMRDGIGNFFFFFFQLGKFYPFIYPRLKISLINTLIYSCGSCMFLIVCLETPINFSYERENTRKIRSRKFGGGLN